MFSIVKSRESELSKVDREFFNATLISIRQMHAFFSPRSKIDTQFQVIHHEFSEPTKQITDAQFQALHDRFLEEE